MAKTIFTGAHRHFVDVLTETRRRSGLTQAQLARAIGRDQSYISLIERSQHRIDVVEFYNIAMAMDGDPAALFAMAIKRILTEAGS